MLDYLQKNQEEIFATMFAFTVGAALLLCAIEAVKENPEATREGIIEFIKSMALVIIICMMGAYGCSMEIQR